MIVNRMKLLFPGLLLLFAILPARAQTPDAHPFAWDRATIALVEPDYAGQEALATRITNGYFAEHGIDVLRLSQLSSPGDTTIQAALQQLIDTAHAAGLRVVADVAIEPKDTLATGTAAVIENLARQVEMLGLDGYCLRAAYQVSPDLAKALKRAADRALRIWQTKNAALSPGHIDFWMAALADAQASALPLVFDAVFEPTKIGAEDVDQDPFITAAARSEPPQRVAVALPGETPDRILLLPGPVQVTYNGEETDARTKAVAQFRHQHLALAFGLHKQINEAPYAFHRAYRYGLEEDHVIVVLGAETRTRLNVSRIFPDDTALRDTATGKIAIVSYGLVSFTPGEGGMLLIEEVQ